MIYFIYNFEKYIYWNVYKKQVSTESEKHGRKKNPYYRIRGDVIKIQFLKIKF